MTVGPYQSCKLIDPDDLFVDFSPPRCEEVEITTDDGRKLYAWACKNEDEWTFDLTENSCVAAFQKLNEALADYAKQGGDLPSIDDELPYGEMSLESVPEEFGPFMVDFVVTTGDDDSFIREQLSPTMFEKNPDDSLKATLGNLVWIRDPSGAWSGPSAEDIDYLLDELADDASI